MADEWDECIDTVGKSFGKNNFSGDYDRQKDKNNAGTGDNTYQNDRYGGKVGRGGGNDRGRSSFNYNTPGSNDYRKDDHYDQENTDNGGSYNRCGGNYGRGGGRGSRGRGYSGDKDQDIDSNKFSEEKVSTDKPREFYIPPDPTDNEEEIFNTGIGSGINFSKYDKIPIKVSDGAPPAVSSFKDAGLKDFLLENIRRSGYIVPTPIQKNALPAIMAKRDLMACAQTGSGKTAAFLLPMINDLLTNSYDLCIGKPQVLIISPTRELSIQIFNEARKFSLGSYLKISIVYGGTAVKHQGDNISKGCHILVCTPGRLLDFVDRAFLTFEDTRYVVLDEADRLLDMGFIPSVEKVMYHETMRPQEQRQTLMFSATFPEDIQRLAGKFLNNYVFIAIGIVGGACSDVEQQFFQVTKFEKRNKLSEILEQETPHGTMVFVETKRNADFLASLLSETKFPTTSIHGDRLQREREEALRDFKSGKMMILIATSVAARGLDIKNVHHVINYDLPKSIEDYVHRIGRTGRVGNKGKATSFYDPSNDSALAPALVKTLKLAEQPIPDFLEGISCRSAGYTQQFGGKDVRNKEPTQALPQEPDEEW